MATASFAASVDILASAGGGVGRAVGASLQRQGIDYRIIERQSQRIRNSDRYVLGDADDDMNVYLTLYCRRLRPDAQIRARTNVERNVSTLHRAGADFVLSYATTGANALFNLLRRSDLLSADSELVVIGDAEAETRFHAEYREGSLADAWVGMDASFGPSGAANEVAAS